MRAISDSKVRTFAKKASVSMAGDNIALVLNNAFSPVSRSDLFPDTLFDSFKKVKPIQFETPELLEMELRVKQSLILLFYGLIQQMNPGQ